MIEFEQALDNILSNTNQLPTEKAMIDKAVGRVLAEDVYSDIEMPPFNKSAMDGYAVKSIDIKRIPAKLKCIGSIEAGEVFTKRVHSGECVKIMTGAALPEDTDCIVMVEDTRQAQEFVEILRPGARFKNVCLQAEDIKKRQKVIEEGKVVSISDVALLATIGRRFLRAVKKPVVAVLNTGGEVVPVGNKLSKKKIYNSNGPQLLAFLKLDGLVSRFLGIAKDNPEELTRVIKEGFKNNILLISGGVSMGDCDLVPEILQKLGVKKIFHKVNIKPGKPLFFGKKKDTLIFGIPGNPVSNFLAYHIFIQPALYKMMGNKQYGPGFKEGIIESEFRNKPGRKHFVLVEILNRKNRYYITPIKNHGSADTLALSEADGFMVVEKNISVVKRNSKIKFITWKTI